MKYSLLVIEMDSSSGIGFIIWKIGAAVQQFHYMPSQLL